MTNALLALFVVVSQSRGAIAANILANLDSPINYTHGGPPVMPEGSKVTILESSSPVMQRDVPRRLDGTPLSTPPQIYWGGYIGGHHYDHSRPSSLRFDWGLGRDRAHPETPRGDQVAVPRTPR